VERPRPQFDTEMQGESGNLYGASLPSLHGEFCKIDEVGDWHWSQCSPRHGAGSLWVAEEVSRNLLSLT
jgi:hypothetical protein